MGLTERFVQSVRAALGLALDTTLPQLDRTAYYRAKVDAASSDGKTLDITPINKKIPARQAVPLRVGIPGAVNIVQAGAVVLYGWDEGDPSKPHCVPCWDDGATVTKLILNATMVHLGSESGSQFVALANKVQDYLTALSSAVNGWTPAPNDGGAALKAALTSAGIIGGTWGTDVAATKAKAV